MIFSFDKINPLFSFIRPKVFGNQYDNYKLIVSREAPSESTRLFTSILYLIFAISIRFSEAHPETPMEIKSKIYPKLEERLFDSAHEVISKLSFEWQSFELIQSWILVTFYLRATHCQNSSFASLGTAIRMCKGMSLILNIVVEAPLRHYEVIKAERIFWLVYTWDKLYSYQSGKEFEIHDSTVSLELPPLVTSSADDWLEQPALAMIHLAKIAGQIQYHNLKTAGMGKEFLCNINYQLQNWRNWCDGNLQRCDYDPLLVDQIYLTYHDIVLSLYNKMLRWLLDFEMEFDGSIAHTAILLAHSSEVLTIFDRIQGKNLLFIPWWLNLSLLFNVAIIDVILINAGLYHEKCTSDFQKVMNFLTQLKDKAGMAEECIWTLRMVNHLCVLRFVKSLKSLTGIGIDHGPNNVNKARFLQFEKVEERIQKHTDEIELEFFKGPHIMGADNTETGESYYKDGIPNSNDDLFASLTWFDQWSNEN
ncbi:BA75_04348T0 [Komagataella pastoris]|uniref:BA75_04348T0 n=1 Tax=Komagataella pastoris TaxID=4922 RepID=A0A1B2JFT0_PICPA|nr:BA75_04348T0 [Komagataella pastoris]